MVQKKYELLNRNEQSKMNWNSLVERKKAGVLAHMIPGFLLFKYLISWAEFFLPVRG